jgi:ATP-dependent RNA helicase RhlE
MRQPVVQRKTFRLTSFEDLGLAAPILKALAEERHTTPTPIQANAIPPVVAGRDLLGIAQTGTGKTAAFALPILNRLAQTPRRPQPRSVRVLVLSPTRELCGQILERFRAYGRHLRLRSDIVIGGVPMGRQIRAASQGLDILVATPGRLLDLVEQKALRLDGVEVLVLDEADHMLDMGFIHAIRAIVARIPAERQNLFFSATMPPDIAKLASQILSDPVEVKVTPVAKTADRVQQSALFVNGGDKPSALVGILRDPAVERVLVFTRTKRGADRVVDHLEANGVGAEAIHGNKGQSQRERALAAFRKGNVRVLVATDIAARGIDVENVSHVVNYDLPNVPESYVHRIGRTARAGAEVIAISLVARDEQPYLRSIEKLIGQAVPVVPGSHDPRPAQAARPSAEAARPGNGGRPAQKRRRPAHAAGYAAGKPNRPPRSAAAAGDGAGPQARAPRPRRRRFRPGAGASGQAQAAS